MVLRKCKSVIKKIKYFIFFILFVGILLLIFFYFFGKDLCILVFKNIFVGEYLKVMFLVLLFMFLN